MRVVLTRTHDGKRIDIRSVRDDAPMLTFNFEDIAESINFEIEPGESYTTEMTFG